VYDGEQDVLALAVALLAGVAQNHPFTQGNKRTALIGARNFLQSNGYDLDIKDEVLGPAVLDLVAGHIDEDDLAEILEGHLVDI
jgi:death on curing protein